MLVIPLLVETARRSTVDRVLVVDCSEELQIRRCRRETAPRSMQARAHPGRAGHARRAPAAADDVIVNDGDLAPLRDRWRRCTRATCDRPPSPDLSFRRLRTAHASSRIRRWPPRTCGSTLAAPENETLVFEQPLNERMRTFLRLDFLYTQALYHNEVASQWGSRAAMACLLDVLAISTRGDVRSDVLKELERHSPRSTSSRRGRAWTPGGCSTVMSNLLRLRSELLNAGSTFLQPLRDSEFLSAIKHRSAIPGGTCEFDLPDYYYWLSQPAEARTRDLQRVARAAAAAVRWHRGAAVAHAPERARARRKWRRAARSTSPSIGTRRSSCCASRCRRSAGLYPEISGSHYRCSIRFLTWNGLTARPTQSESDVPFILSCCQLSGRLSPRVKCPTCEREIEWSAELRRSGRSAASAAG